MLAALWVLLLAAAGWYFFTRGISVDQVREYLTSYGIWSAPAFILAYTVRPLVFFPTSIMTPLAAVLFGPWLGWALTYVGENLSATVAFFAARYFGRSFVRSHEKGFLKKYDDRLRDCGFETVLLLRLIPLFPFDFVNYAAGLSAVRYGSYLAGTLLGVIPGLTAYIFLGGSLTDPRLLIPSLALFALITAAAHWRHRHIARRKKDPVAPADTAAQVRKDAGGASD